MSQTNLPAGPELDARIAVEVLAWTNVREIAGAVWGSPPGRSYDTNVPRYSERPDSALEVMEALRARGWLVILKAMPDGLPFLAFETTEIKVRYVCSGQWMRRSDAAGTRRAIVAHPAGMADTLALAVCRCAVQCVEAEGKDEGWLDRAASGEPEKEQGQ